MNEASRLPSGVRVTEIDVDNESVLRECQHAA